MVQKDSNITSRDYWNSAKSTRKLRRDPDNDPTNSMKNLEKSVEKTPLRPLNAKARHKDEIDDFHDHLNEQNADIQFTKEIEEMENFLF